MWSFLAALAGGLVALLGSIGTTYYVQRQALKAERRARATRAADEILTAVTELRQLPATGSASWCYVTGCSGECVSA